MAKKERKYIKIRGASEHNLKCVSLDIPRDEFVVFTGLSGSGKSSPTFLFMASFPSAVAIHSSGF